jgi:hypothetical protein
MAKKKTLVIKVDLENDAFADHWGRLSEVGTILNDLIESWDHRHSIKDSNGNTVGYVTVRQEEW